MTEESGRCEAVAKAIPEGSECLAEFVLVLALVAAEEGLAVGADMPPLVEAFDVHPRHRARTQARSEQPTLGPAVRVAVAYATQAVVFTWRVLHSEFYRLAAAIEAGN